MNRRRFAQRGLADSAGPGDSVARRGRNRGGTALARAKDHGRLAYFKDTVVVDLAGVIDAGLTEHLDGDTMGAYLRAHDAGYYIDGVSPVHKAVERSVRTEKVWAPRTPARWDPALWRITAYRE